MMITNNSRMEPLAYNVMVITNNSRIEPLAYLVITKGRRQNEVAAAPIFSSQLQPTYIGKVMHRCLNLQHFGCSQGL